MRYLLYSCVLLALLASVPEPSLAGALASAAGALFEATPYLVGGVFLRRLVGHEWLVAYLGCGCGRGPSARSLPAALATAFVFGPLVAMLRVVSATLIMQAIRMRTFRNRSEIERCAESHDCTHSNNPNFLGELASLVPSMVLAGLVLQLAPLTSLPNAGITAQVFVGAALGFVAAPCALGAVAIASALHTQAPASSVAFLCIAGIADLRTLSMHAVHSDGHDALAYALLVVALAVVAWRGGDALVHPLLAPFLGVAAAAVLVWFLRNRRASNPRTRIAPAIMLAGAFIVAPAPTYTATETTLGNAFPNEHLHFTGVVVHRGAATALVRYAITCCRADATPVVVRLARTIAYPAHTWLTADGTLVRSNNELRLAPTSLKAIAPPSDPFVYR